MQSMGKEILETEKRIPGESIRSQRGEKAIGGQPSERHRAWEELRTWPHTAREGEGI